RVEGFHQREEGAAEETDLVAGGDGHRSALGEVFGPARGLRAAAPERRRRDPRAAARGQQLPSPLPGGFERGAIRGELGSPEELEEERRKPGILRVRNHDGFSGFRARTISRGESGDRGDSSKSPQTEATRSPEFSSRATSSSGE